MAEVFKGSWRSSLHAGEGQPLAEMVSVLVNMPVNDEDALEYVWPVAAAEAKNARFDLI